jgi:putative Ca2+/H+ antiporter (TMEM165/GDT1 family)
MMKNKGQARKEAEIEYISEEQKSGDDVGLTISSDIESSANGSQTQPEKAASTKKSSYSDVISKKLVFWQALTLTFLGEWGDRSQITTIALAAEGSASAVCVGSFLGHVICTTLAVIGGKFLAKKISEKTVNISGGILFLIFGVHNLLMNE